MKTVKELADSIGVSSKTIYRALDRLGQMSKTDKDSPGQALTTKTKGITFITDYGEPIISEFVKPVQRQAGTVKDCQSQMSKPVPPAINGTNEEVLFLREQVKILNEQLLTTQQERTNTQEELSKEREHSRAITDRLATITENQQKLLGMEQFKTASPALMGESDTAPTVELKPTEPIKKRNFFDSLFNWRK